ncbi:MAG: pilus assembly protein [Gammaproteobacteria bacterium]
MMSTKHISSRTRAARLAAFLPGLALWASGTVALADDTEILTGEIGDYAAPNILFVVDTSGSMSGQVLVDNSYDPDDVYTGPFTDPDQMFYVLADGGGNFTYPDDDYVNFGAWVSRDRLVCDQAQTLLPGSGFYVDRFIQFDPNDNDWGFLQGEDDDPIESGVNRFTECFSDEGLHGTGDGVSGTYPANGDSLVPFTTDAASPDRFNWATYPLRYAFFESNYLNWISERAAAGTPVVQTRLEVVQGVTRNLINRLTASGDDPRQQFNVGLMRFSTDAQGGMVLQPVDDISIGTVRNQFLDAVDSMTPSSNTPLSETLYEAYQYLRGGPVDYGATSVPQTSVPTSYTGDLVNGASYISPIEAACQKNYVVLLTDGLPTTDTDANDRIAAITGAQCSGNCLDDLARHMKDTDMLPSLADDQFIDTFTIGFFTDSTLLANTATGEIQPDEDQPPIPGYFLADNVSELSSAFDAIFSEIETDVTTFTSPAASVNSLNRLQNRDVLYFTVFEPSPMGEPHWDGNLKAYRLGRPDGGTQQEPTELAILDADGLPALNDDNTFRATARSIWSATDDGGNVTEGGFISRLSADRDILTNLGGAGLTNIGDNPDLITAAMLGVRALPGQQGEMDAEARRLELLDFALGIDENGDALRMMGDPLHTQPLVITYAGGEDNLGLVATTNDGYMHFLDPTPTDGNIDDLEEWAFIPQDLLSNIDLIERNPPSLPGSNSKLYGLDGPLTKFIPDDIDDIVDPNERLYVYSAMRRGGSSYYGMDLGVGGDDTPQLAFKIDRGGQFANLGQTWSAATPAKVRFGQNTRDVLIFGGGYDPAQDSAGTYGDSTTRGNAIYMVDAVSGQRLWWASSDGGADLVLTDMNHSIPSDVSVLDINGDDIADRLYVGDMAGQVWRIDLLESGIFGAKFAALGEPGSTAGERRFYNAPSVARIFDRNANFLTVSIGSGWRAHPLATNNADRLYVLKDPNVFSPSIDGTTNEPIYPATLTNADLVEVIPPSPADASQLTSSGGWFLELENGGEKNLSKALTVDGKIFFTTYRPDTGPLTCQPTVTVGRGRLYVLDILTGEPALINADGSTSAFEDQPNSGILPSPQLVFVEPPCVENCDNIGPDPDPDDPDPVYATVGGTCLNAVSEVTAVLGIRNVPTDICTAPRRSYWTEADEDLDDL